MLNLCIYFKIIKKHAFNNFMKIHLKYILNILIHVINIINHISTLFCVEKYKKNYISTLIHTHAWKIKILGEEN